MYYYTKVMSELFLDSQFPLTKNTFRGATTMMDFWRVRAFNIVCMWEVVEFYGMSEVISLHPRPSISSCIESYLWAIFEFMWYLDR